jgi:hypothetical protein
MNYSEATVADRPTPWNKDKLIGQTPPRAGQISIAIATTRGECRLSARQQSLIRFR